MTICPYSSATLDNIGHFLASEYPTKPLKGDSRFLFWRTYEHPWSNGSAKSYVALENGKIVGHLACLPEKLVHSGREICASWLVDLRVSKNVKTRVGVGIQLLQAAARDFPVLLVFGVCPEMQGIYQTMGWRKVAQVETFLSVLRPLRTLNLGRPEASPLSRLLQGSANSLCSQLDKTAAAIHGMFIPPAGDHESSVFESIATFDTEIDEFLNSIPRSSRVEMRRTAELLNWKFQRNPFTSFSAWIARSRRTRKIQGYLIVKRFQRGHLGKWMDIVDIQVSPDSLHILDNLVSKARQEAILSELDFLRLRTSDPVVLRTLRFPFWIRFTRPLADDIAGYSAQPALLTELCSSPWSLTALASDAIDYGGDEWAEHPADDDAAVSVASLVK